MFFDLTTAPVFFVANYSKFVLTFFFLRAAPTLPGSKNSLGTKCVEYFCHSLYVLSLLQLFHPEPTTDQHLLLLLALKYATKPL